MMRMFCILKQFTTISLYLLISPFLSFRLLFSPSGPGTAESNNKSENTNRIKANSEKFNRFKYSRNESIIIIKDVVHRILNLKNFTQ